jgi:hypothetical protein
VDTNAAEVGLEGALERTLDGGSQRLSDGLG